MSVGAVTAAFLFTFEPFFNEFSPKDTAKAAIDTTPQENYCGKKSFSREILADTINGSGEHVEFVTIRYDNKISCNRRKCHPTPLALFEQTLEAHTHVYTYLFIYSFDPMSSAMFSVGCIAYVAGSAWKGCNAREWFEGTVVQAGPKQIKLVFPDNVHKVFAFGREELADHQRRFVEELADPVQETTFQNLADEHGPEDARLHLLADVTIGDDIVCTINGSARLEWLAAAAAWNAIDG